MDFIRLLNLASQHRDNAAKQAVENGFQVVSPTGEGGYTFKIKVGNDDSDYNISISYVTVMEWGDNWNEEVETALIKNDDLSYGEFGYDDVKLFNNLQEAFDEVRNIHNDLIGVRDYVDDNLDDDNEEETPFNVSVSSIEDDETKSDDEESDDENLNMAIKMSLNDEMEIDEDYSFKKIYDNLINYFENKENRNNSKDSVNDFFNKFLDNEED
jgi:hypothetical protein